MSDEIESIGSFKIIRSIGNGGTARVYLATRSPKSRPVALKTALDSAPGEVRQFYPLIKREYDLIGNLLYPGLIRVHDLNYSNDKYPFLTLEYCPGDTLDKIGVIHDPPAFLNLLSSIAINLYYLKIAGLSHGDLKPQNIFLAAPLERMHRGHKTYTKISDFSLALKTDSSNHNRLGLGTVGYIAPETLADGTLNHKSDIFALGIIAYILATGIHPFIDKFNDPVRTNSRVKEYEPEPPHALDDSVSSEISDLILKMLAKSPSDRPEDGFQICRELEKIGATLPYRTMIRPKHILQALNSDHGINILSNFPFDLDEKCRKAIYSLAGDDPVLIRHLLESNFGKGNFIWNDSGKFCPSSPSLKLHWPQRMQRQQGKAFKKLNWSKKKKAVGCAVLGNTEDAMTLGIIEAPERRDYPPPLLTFLGGKVSSRTKRLINQNLARKATSGKNLYLAALLHFQAGNLDEGYSPALDFINEAINASDFDKALEIAEKYIRLAHTAADYDRLKILLRQKADLAKRTGQIGRAEKLLLEIVEQYKGKKADRFLAEVFKELGDLYKMKQDYNSGIKALRQAEQVFHEIDDKLELSHTLNNIGNIYWIDARYDEAWSYYLQAFKIQRRLQAIDDVASTLSNMASIYFFRERFDRAIRLFKLSLRLKRLTGNALEIARTLNNLGYVYTELGSLEKAIDCLEESLQLNEKVGAQKDLLYNLENLTLVMLYAGRLRESIAHLKKGLKIAETLGDEPHQGVFLRGLATVQKRMGYYGQALENIERAIIISEKSGDEPHLILCLIQMGDCYYRLNILGKAYDIYLKIDELARKLGDRRAQISSIILQSQIDSDYRHLDKARQIAEELKLTRNIRHILIQKAELALKHNEIPLAAETLEALDNLFDRSETDLEIPRLENLRGLFYFRTGKPDDALETLIKARDLAARSALLPEKCEAAYYLGLVHVHLKEYEKAFGHFREAIGGFKKMATDIKDTDMQQALLKNDLLVSLGQEIKKLNNLLVSK